MAIYHVDYEKTADGIWVATVRGVEGCVAKARSFGEVKGRVPDAIAVSTNGTTRGIRVVDHVKPGSK